MSYLLDTNVISETIKKDPNPLVISFLESINITDFYLSILTLGEIRKGIEKVSDLQKKQKIMQWLEKTLPNQFATRIINIDLKVADKWGYLSSKINIPAIDGLIAASALAYNLKLVTRNIKDFAQVPALEIINPWYESK